MSSTKREGFWANNIDAPYTKPSNKEMGPGPAEYQKDEKKKRFEKKASQSMKDGAKQVGFGSTAERTTFAIKRVGPGPG